ncbi:hypothetical protein PCE1_001278 [Barthelona sp. PCE]
MLKMKVYQCLIFFLLLSEVFAHVSNGNGCSGSWIPTSRRIVSVTRHDKVISTSTIRIETLKKKRSWFKVKVSGTVSEESRRAEMELRKSGAMTIIISTCSTDSRLTRQYSMEQYSDYVRDLTGSEFEKATKALGKSVYDVAFSGDYSFTPKYTPGTCPGHYFQFTGGEATFYLALGHWKTVRTGGSLAMVQAQVKIPKDVPIQNIFYFSMPVLRCQNCGMVTTMRISGDTMWEALSHDPLYIRLYYALSASRYIKPW